MTTEYILDPTGLAQVLVATAGGQSTDYLPGLAQYDGSRWEYFVQDRLGSIRQLAGPTGQLLLSQSFDPFGSVLAQAGSGQSRFGYTGEQVDPTGLVYLRARYYAPGVGRFLTADTVVPDPLRSVGWNRYAYSYNNPIRYSDPSGNCPECLGDFIQGAIYEATANNYEALFIPADSPFRREAEALAAEKQENIWFQSGRLVGALGNVGQGLAEIESGLAMIGGGGVGGTLTIETGVGAIAGCGVAAAGVGIATHGGIVAGQGAIGVGNSAGSILKIVFGRGGRKGTTKLYRAVSKEELLHLELTGRFESVGQSVEGKYFAESVEDAAQWGDLLYAEGEYFIVEIELSTTVADKFYRWKKLDNIGPARFATIEQLQDIDMIIRVVR